MFAADWADRSLLLPGNGRSQCDHRPSIYRIPHPADTPGSPGLAARSPGGSAVHIKKERQCRRTRPMLLARVEGFGFLCEEQEDEGSRPSFSETFGENKGKKRPKGRRQGVARGH
ncbi:VPS10 domain-containing receptor SorCS3 [Anopheles sinensis]|uniref:VPS10 domain-containing receptor SorCS3 n=1 Tax=Anopheles sinensis TaxID=74873 RepID=A0A084WTB6_ANOSI|nr:VPS10 domain-containing receptor SorCS3 [Anopheles sinensis]